MILRLSELLSSVITMFCNFPFMQIRSLEGFYVLLHAKDVVFHLILEAFVASPHLIAYFLA